MTVCGLALVSFGQAAERRTVVLSKELCDQVLVAHQSAPDVNYEPNRTVEGDPLLPANVNDFPPLRLPETLEIPIEMFRDRGHHHGPIFTLPTGPGHKAHFERTEDAVELGSVIFNMRDQRLYYNGQPLQDDLLKDIEQACQRLSEATP